MFSVVLFSYTEDVCRGANGPWTIRPRSSASFRRRCFLPSSQSYLLPDRGYFAYREWSAKAAQGSRFALSRALAIGFPFPCSRPFIPLLAPVSETALSSSSGQTPDTDLPLRMASYSCSRADFYIVASFDWRHGPLLHHRCMGSLHSSLAFWVLYVDHDEQSQVWVRGIISLEVRYASVKSFLSSVHP